MSLRSSAACPSASTEATPELSPRQRQILELLREGKANKEIARELGIGLGTVKQHVVVLFKKLNVRNRAMAVSRGEALLRDEGATAQAAAGLMAQEALERRPCVVLSVSLPEGVDPAATRRLQRTLAGLAFDGDALFLARRGNAGDLVFGIQRLTDHDLFTALRTARSIYEELADSDPGLAGTLRGGLTAGLAMVSMKRHGGWSGEALASATISAARELMATAAPGDVVIGEPAQGLMRAFGVGEGGEGAGVRAFAELDTLRWSDRRRPWPVVGRDAERERLERRLRDAETGHGCLLYLEGETGMGKSRLCGEAADGCRAHRGELFHFIVLPPATEPRCQELPGGEACTVEAVLERMAGPLHGAPAVVVVDDFHLLDEESRRRLRGAGAAAAAAGRLVILSGRRVGAAAECGAERIHLRRLDDGAVAILAREILGEGRRGEAAAVVEYAAGVPLFAVELAHRPPGDEPFSLPLLIVVGARLDGLKLDRSLLRVVAGAEGGLAPEAIADALGESAEALAPALERARAAGVLVAGADGRVTFHHPLLRRYINYLEIE